VKHIHAEHNKKKDQEGYKYKWEKCNAQFKKEWWFNNHTCKDCPHCGKHCRSKHHLTTHIESVHPSGENKFECEICHKKYKTHLILVRHKQQVHNKMNRFKCICGFETNSNPKRNIHQHTCKEWIEQHEKNDKDVKPEEPEKCNKDEEPEKCDKDEEPEKCDTPNNTEKSPNNTLKCPFCKKIPDTKELLDLHMFKHFTKYVGKYKYNCSCGFKTNKIKQYQKHQQSNPDHTIEIIKSTDLLKKYNSKRKQAKKIHLKDCRKQFEDPDIDFICKRTWVKTKWDETPIHHHRMLYLPDLLHNDYRETFLIEGFIYPKQSELSSPDEILIDIKTQYKQKRVNVFDRIAYRNKIEWNRQSYSWRTAIAKWECDHTPPNPYTPITFKARVIREFDYTHQLQLIIEDWIPNPKQKIHTYLESEDKHLLPAMNKFPDSIYLSNENVDAIFNLTEFPSDVLHVKSQNTFIIKGTITNAIDWDTNTFNLFLHHAGCFHLIEKRHSTKYSKTALPTRGCIIQMKKPFPLRKTTFHKVRITRELKENNPPKRNDYDLCFEILDSYSTNTKEYEKALESHTQAKQQREQEEDLVVRIMKYINRPYHNTLDKMYIDPREDTDDDGYNYNHWSCEDYEQATRNIEYILKSNDFPERFRPKLKHLLQTGYNGPQNIKYIEYMNRIILDKRAERAKCENPTEDS
jgi:hypothetical protein